MMVDTKTQDTLKTAVNTVMEDNESLTDGECLDVLIEAINAVLIDSSS
jgi:hypothetical protein